MRVDTIKDYQEAMEIIKKCENIIRTNKKKTIGFAYKRGKNFKKFKEDANFKDLVEQFGTSKSTIIIFKINMVKLVDKYKKKNGDYKYIKNICKKNPDLFS